MQEKQRAFLVRTAYWAVWAVLLWLGVRYLLRWLLPFLLALALAAVILVLTRWVKPTKGLHPIVFILASAVVGVVFNF